MVMDTMQIRLSKGVMERINNFVRSGMYSNKSEVIRDAVRHFVWKNEVGTIKFKGNAEKTVREARSKLSKEKVNLVEINSL